MKNRAQAGLEFVLLISFIMFIFILIFSVISNNIARAKMDEQQRQLKEVGDLIESEVKTAQAVNDGYSRIFELPIKVGEYDYKIDINPYVPGISDNSELIITMSDVYQGNDDEYKNVRFFRELMINASPGCNRINKTNGTIEVYPELDIMGNQLVKCDDECGSGSNLPCGPTLYVPGICIPGEKVCVDGIWGPCNSTGPAEDPEVSCDGLDNDCDGIIDEGCNCLDGATQPCGSGIGACTHGTMTCSGGVWGVCVGGILPTDEVCDGVDNDCDSTIDEFCSCGTEYELLACGTDVGVCEKGLQQCLFGYWHKCSGNVDPPEDPELTLDDALDNDCDGAVDEGSECSSGTRDCGTDVGACTFGTQTCVSGYWSDCIGGVQPTDETCDGVDNDCDGVDDLLDNMVAPVASNNYGVCKTISNQYCDGSSFQEPVYSGVTGYQSIETCGLVGDHLDNDCDGAVDEPCAVLDSTCEIDGTCTETISYTASDGVENIDIKVLAMAPTSDSDTQQLAPSDYFYMTLRVDNNNAVAYTCDVDIKVIESDDSVRTRSYLNNIYNIPASSFSSKDILLEIPNGRPSEIKIDYSCS